MDTWTLTRYKGPRRWLVFWMVMLMLVMVQFFSLIPLLPLSESNMSFATFFIVALFIQMQTREKKHNPTIQQMKPMLWLIASVLLSFIPAYLYFHQPAFQSFLTCRKFLCYLTLPLLLVSRPTKEELRYSFYIFTYIWLFTTVCVTFYLQSWVLVADGGVFIDEGDILHCLPGRRLVCITFIFALDHYLENRSVRTLVTTIFFFLCVLVMFSRTMLLAAVSVIVLATLRGRTVRARMAGLTSLVIFISIFTYLAVDQLTMLIEETSSQVVDLDYNRNKAFIYMFSSQRNILTILLGNGFISGHVDSLIFDLQEQGIYYSDVGLVGMWNQFGILAVIVILGTAIKGLSRDYSFSVRAISVFILVSSLTIGYFVYLECIFWLCLFWYLMALETDDVKRLRRQRKEERAIRRQRYRSINA